MRVDDADMRDVDEAGEGLPEISDDEDIAESSSSDGEDEDPESDDGVKDGAEAVAGLRGKQRQPQPWQQDPVRVGTDVKVEERDVGVSAVAAASLASAGGVARLAGRVAGLVGGKGGVGAGDEGVMSLKRVKVEARYDELEAIAAVIAGKAGGDPEPTLLDAVKGKQAGGRQR